MGLDFLHTKCNIIHTDLKPENVLLCPSEGEFSESLEAYAAALAASGGGAGQSTNPRNREKKRKAKVKGDGQGVHEGGLDGEDDADAPRFMLLTSSCSLFSSFSVVWLKCRGILAGHYFGCVRQLLHVPEPRQRHLRFRRHPPLSFRIEVRSALPIDPWFRSRCRCIAAVSP